MEGFRERRDRVLEAVDGVVLIPSAPVTIRNNDVEHDYRQDSDLFYLTGFDEPECVLLLTTAHAKHRSVMFVRERDPAREQWDGSRAGVAGAKERCGVDATYPIGELDKRLPGYMKGASTLVYEMGRDADLDRRVLSAVEHARGRGRSANAWPSQIAHPEALIHEMRLIKSPAELEVMRQAAAVSTEAHVAAMAAAAPGKFEYEMEAIFRETFRRRGAKRVAYSPIVGSGPNATILHYRDNDRRMEEGDLLLIDAGCEYGYYASDITRTFPVSGRFSEPQRKVYEVVLEAQLAAIEATVVGADIEAIHEVTRRKLVEGMVRIGLLEGEVDALIESDAYRAYYMHRTSHWLGMDVHDVGSYFVDGKPRPLASGMVLTIEPGIYVSADAKDAPEEYRGIGVRIEDDILVTDAGPDNLTAAVPKTIEDVERACAG